MLQDNPEGSGGKGGGRGAQDGGIRVHPWLIHVMYDKNHLHTVK